VSRKVRSLTANEPLELLAELAEATYGKDEPLANVRYLDWKFRKNPYGTIVELCEADHQALGCGALVKVPMKISNTVLQGAMGGDIMVHPDYRHQGIFVGLAQEGFKLASDIALTYATRDLRSLAAA
jgi:GNAT superfamily N-acetyltransferase